MARPTVRTDSAQSQIHVRPRLHCCITCILFTLLHVPQSGYEWLSNQAVSKALCALNSFAWPNHLMVTFVLLFCSPLVVYSAGPDLVVLVLCLPCTAPGEAWVLFLEKAFAQLFGNYSKLEYNFPEIALQCLTGRGGGWEGCRALEPAEGSTGGGGGGGVGVCNLQLDRTSTRKAG
jgi:hypothetical protein